MTCGVYRIIAPSGKCYIGSSVNMDMRRAAHHSLLKHGKHPSPALQSAWDKYGDRLEFQHLLVCAPNLRLFYEQRAIDVLRPRYNGLQTAVCGAKPGRPVSAETRAKLSSIHGGKRLGGAVSLPWLGKTFSAAHREKLAAAKRGKVGPRVGQRLPPETCALISAKLKGRSRSLESRAKQSAAWAAKRAAA